MVEYDNDFLEVPILNNISFSWAFLVDWIFFIFVSLFVLLYLNRLLAYMITKLLEWTVWKKYHVKINIESLKISLLGGRIFFKNLTVITRDKTISVLQGYITWRYWLLKYRQIELECNESEEKNISKNLPCRFSLLCDGLEIFIYNRVDTYDNILQSIFQEDKSKYEKFMDEIELNIKEENLDGTNIPSCEDILPVEGVEYDRIKSKGQESLPIYLWCLPLQILVNKGAVVVGNKFTPSVAIYSYEHGAGSIDISSARETVDNYQFKVEMDFKSAELSIKPNSAYEHDTTNNNMGSVMVTPRFWQRFTNIFKNFTSICGFGESFDTSSVNNLEFINKWKGLGIYIRGIDDDIEEEVEFDILHHEYAKYSKILKCEKIRMIYLYDDPGIEPYKESFISLNDNNNIEPELLPPEFSLDFRLYKASIYYGPWAHRQVNHFQKKFFPTVSRDIQPFKKPSSGMKRVYGIFTLTISILEDSVWRVPTREPSKDHEFLKNYRETNDDFRSFGWFDLTIRKNSDINFNISIYPGKNGYENTLLIYLEEPELTSSVNHDVFFKAKSHKIKANLGFPLKWNEKTHWEFDFESSNVETFFLRDHIILISDLVSDLTSGEPTPYALFKPFIYTFKWSINLYAIYLNVNDANIINNPLDFNENCYLSLQGDSLDISVSIPLDVLSRNSTTISYELFTPKFSLQLYTQSWNTLREFMKNKEVGQSSDFFLSGTYMYYSDVDLDNMDTIIIRCSSKDTMLKCYGFVIRYLVNIKMNYFGDFIHFKTTEEYTNELNNDKVHEKYAEHCYTGSSNHNEKDSIITQGDKDQLNDLNSLGLIKKSSLKRVVNEKDVWVTFSVENGCILLSENIYDYRSFISLYFDVFEVDMRYLDYYMDLQINILPIYLKRYTLFDSGTIFDTIKVLHSNITNHDGILSNLNIHAHRMFGLPPLEDPYFCKWDFSFESLDINSDISFVKGMVNSFKKVAFGLSDYENILLFNIAKSFDMTYLIADFHNICIKIRDLPTNNQVVIIVPTLEMRSLNFECQRYSSRLNINIPDIEITVVNLDKTGNIVGKIKTSLDFTNFKQNRNFNYDRMQQRRHITLNDAPYHRCDFFLPWEYRSSTIYSSLYGAITPSSSLPSALKPISSNDTEYMLEKILGEFYLEFRKEYDIDCLKNTSMSKYSFKVHTQQRYSSNSQQYTKICPNYEPQTEYEYNNFIVKINDINVILDPNIGYTITNIYEDYCIDTIEEIMDSNEMDIVTRFSKYFEEKSTATNIKLVCPSANLIMGTLCNNYDSKTYDHLSLHISDFNIGCSTKNIYSINYAVNLSGIMYEKEYSYYINIKSLTVSISKKNKNHQNSPKISPSASATLNMIKGFSSSIVGMVNNVDCEHFSLLMNHRDINWLFSFIIPIIININKLRERIRDFKKDTIDMERDLFFRLTLASRDYHVEHDPPVITKPAYITRLSYNHVRENTSWRIIIRLRHILNCLPRSWYERHFQELKRKEFKAVKNSHITFLDIFKGWRSWEFSDIDQCYFYKKMFLRFKLEKPSGSQNFFNIFIGYIKLEGGASCISASKIHVTIKNNVDSLLMYDNTVFESFDNENSVWCSVSSINCCLHESILDYVRPIVFTLEEIKTSKKKPTNIDKNMESYLSEIQLYLKESSLKITLGQYEFSSFFQNLQFALLITKSPTIPSCVFSMLISLSMYTFSYKYEKLKLLNIHGNKLFLTLLRDQENNHMIIDVENNLISINTMNISTQQLVMAISFIIFKTNEITDKLQILLKKDNIILNTETEKSTKVQSLNFKFTGTFSEINCYITIFTPFIVQQNMLNMQVLVDNIHDISYIIKMDSIDFDILSSIKNHIHLKSSHSLINLEISKFQNLENILWDFDINFEVSKITILDLHENVDIFFDNNDITMNNFNMLKSFFETNFKTPNKRLIKNMWSLRLNAEYIGFLMELGSIGYIIELNTISLNSSKKNNDNTISDIIGDVSVENICFLIKDRRLKDNLSKIVDFSVSIKLSFPKSGVLYDIQIESSHFRIVLCPMSAVKLIWLAQELLIIKEIFQLKVQKVDKLQPDISMNQIFSSIHILSYNFCIGWIFDFGVTNHPGLIWGYERLFAAYDNPYGKITLLDAYFSIANGNTSNSFYNSGNENNKYNRTYLSNMQIAYWFSKDDISNDLFIKVTGGKLEVNMLPNVIKIAHETVQSINSFQNLMKTLVNPSESMIIPINTHNDYSKDFSSFPSLLSSITSIQCDIDYAGTVFTLFSTEIFTNSYHSSFQLKSPSITVSISYKNCSQIKKNHWIRTIIKADSTHNILYPTCVPVLIEMRRDIYHMLRDINKNSNYDISKSQNSSEINYKNLLESFDISLIINISNQNLSLTCEPKAKIQADIGFERFGLKIFTNQVDALEPLCLSLQIKNLNAASRHIYSREISASAKIEYISAILDLTHHDIIHSYGIMTVSDIDIFFNIKELQDLNLFMDIWTLGKEYDTAIDTRLAKESRVKSTHSLSSKYHEVTNNMAFPWNYVIILDNMRGDIDLGPSLGVISLRSDCIWTISEHNVDWSQYLSILLRNVVLCSKGRLSGEFVINDISWSSNIKWPIVDNRYKMPIVDVKISFKTLSAKISFDYHMFFIGNISNLSFILYNERDKEGILKDLLVVQLSCDSICVFLTALASANIFDISKTIKRIRQDNKTFYLATLKDSDTQKNNYSNPSIKLENKIASSLSLLHTNMFVDIKRFRLQVFPSALFDTKVLVFGANHIEARVSTKSNYKIKTALDFQIRDMNVSLSSFKNHLDELQISRLEISEYIESATKTHGGTIFVVPSVFVSMTTWQEPSTNVVEFLYSSSFGDSIDIKWNLGPVNFIKEMWTTHLHAIALRRHEYKDEKTVLHNEDIEKRIKEINLGDVFTYIPIEEPHIDMPRLKDLGGATPPIEWFGLNRNRFPGLAHQMIVVPFQNLLNLAEDEYIRVLGNA